MGEDAPKTFLSPWILRELISLKSCMSTKVLENNSVVLAGRRMQGSPSAVNVKELLT